MLCSKTRGSNFRFSNWNHKAGHSYCKSVNLLSKIFAQTNNCQINHSRHKYPRIFQNFLNNKKMKVFGAIFALVSAQQFPSEWDTNSHFWLSAATESRNGAGGVGQITNIRCNRSVNIKVSRVPITAWFSIYSMNKLANIKNLN